MVPLAHFTLTELPTAVILLLVGVLAGGLLSTGTAREWASRLRAVARRRLPFMG